MLSLTGAHTGLTDFEILERFREAWDKIREISSCYELSVYPAL